MRDDKKHSETQMLLQSATQQASSARPKERKCPFCAELILEEAIVCKHCGRDIVGGDPPSASPPPVVKTNPQELKIKCKCGANLTTTKPRLSGRTVQFFLSRNGKVTGPVSSNAIKKGFFSGKLLTTDYISTAATGPWKPIGDIPQLNEFIPAPEYTYNDNTYDDNTYDDNTYDDNTYDDNTYDDDVYEPPPAPVSRRRSPDRNRRQSPPSAPAVPEALDLLI